MLQHKKLSFKNHPIRILINKDGVIEWVCIFDICTIIRRPTALVDDPHFTECLSSRKVMFGNRDLYAIKPDHIDRLLRFVRKDSKGMEQRCSEIIDFIKTRKTNPFITTVDKKPCVTSISTMEHKENFDDMKISMTSVEIANITGTLHKNTLQSIREMEKDWVDITGSPFKLSTYKDSTGRTLPCYELSKVEALYVGSKSNNAARARIVLRLEELEEVVKRQAMSRFAVPTNLKEALLLAYNQQVEIERMEPKEAYYNHVIQDRSIFTTNSIAGELNMSYPTLIRHLEKHNIVFKEESGLVAVAKKYEGWMEEAYSENNPTPHRKWNKKGRDGIISIVKPQMPK